jgi:microcystin-dependent protein
MFGIVRKDGNNNKYIHPLTSDVGAGAPVGTIIAQYKKANPEGYLYLDGSTFDADQYPALYMYLGTNVLPDYREFALVGAEQNSTETIAAHDVYTEGEAKDDQLQTHQHTVSVPNVGTQSSVVVAGGSGYFIGTITATSNNNSGRTGTVTRGKRKAVFFYIKATSGLAENQQENVLNTVKDYYTPEVIWENSNPTSGFAAQTLTAQDLGVDLSQYTAIDVIIKNYKSGANYTMGRVYKDTTIQILAAASQISYRKVSFTNSGIEFFAASLVQTYGGSGSTDNDMSVPIKIYGIR